MYNVQRYKSAHAPVSMSGVLDRSYCISPQATPTNPTLGPIRRPYGSWAIGLRYASNNKQFTRLAFKGQKGSGVFPGTGGTAGNISTYFKVNTRGSYCGDLPAMGMNLTLTYN